MKKVGKSLLMLLASAMLIGFAGCKPEIKYVEKEVEKTVEKEKLVYTTAVKAGTYTVYHYQQDTSGGKAFENYTLFNTENSKVVAEDSTLKDLKNSYTGFTAKALAQNENVLYVFYDRNIITYTFHTGSEGKLNDGTTERIVEGLYGANVLVPNPLSSTHHFCGWFTNTNMAIPKVFGDHDLTFSVRWIEKWCEIPVDAETGITPTMSSKYIYFGVFPKTVLSETCGVTIDETEMKVMGANTYYKGSDGEYYEKVTVTVSPYASSYIYSDGTEIIEDTIRYFKVEPIKWRVLTTNFNSTNNALLLAEDILTSNVPFYVDIQNRTIDVNTVYPNNYKYSTIRAYLNGVYENDDTQTKTYDGKGFFQTAFTKTAQSKIATTTVDNRKETTGYSESSYAENYACEDTNDKIFLLSESEVINSDFGFAAYNSSGVGNTRIRVTTDYANANSAIQSEIDGYGVQWWLRSPFYNSNCMARYVNYDGRTSRDYNSVASRSYGVVPALCISLQ